MDYFDDLDNQAMDTFRELNDNAELVDATLTSTLSPELENLIRTAKQQHVPIRPVKHRSCAMDYLFRICSPLTPIILASAAVLPSQPKIVHGESENGPTQFCQLNELDIPILKCWLATTFPSLLPVLAPMNKARREFSPFSAAPTLGLDTTLPHHRPNNDTMSSYRPTQDQYPVWYFFYGTLTDSSVLAQLFGSAPATTSPLVPAKVQHGRLRTWSGKYKALVDAPGFEVDGWAYEVQCQEQEDALRMYETAKYEVVRVAIMLNEKSDHERVTRGCTFRFVGYEDELV